MKIFEIFRSITNRVVLPRISKGQRVRYKFNIPGLKNFHLLPYQSKKYFLNTFQPHMNGLKSFSQSFYRQLR